MTGTATGTAAAAGGAAAAAPRARDAASFEAAVRPHYAPLLRRLTLVLGDPHDAEDAAQDTYLKAYRAWPAFSGTDARAWLYTIGLHVAFDTLRHRRRWSGRLAWLGRPDAPGREPSYVDRVDPDLWAALARLEPRHRAALLANVLDGYTQREIATVMGVPEGTVASWLSRGRAALREALAPDG